MLNYVHDLSNSIFGDTNKLIPFELVVVSVSCECGAADDSTIAGDMPTNQSSDALVDSSAGIRKPATNQYLSKRQCVGAGSDVGSENQTLDLDNDLSVFVPVNNTGRRLVRCRVSNRFIRNGSQVAK